MDTIEFKKIKQNDPYYVDVLALRYKVYCDERGFEHPDDHSDGLEMDHYDPHSIHFAAILKHTQQVVGTVRLILYSGEGFPVENSFELTNDHANLQRKHMGELSRLALSRSNRDRLQDKSHVRLKFKRSKVLNGLFHCVAKECVELGISHLYAAMAKGLYVLLVREKITFLQIGPEKEYHGLRAPYLGTVKDIIDQNPLLLRGDGEQEKNCDLAAEVCTIEEVLRLGHTRKLKKVGSEYDRI